MFSENAVSSHRILYTPSTFAKSTLLYLQETGTLTALKPHKSTRSNLKSYLFFLILEGEGRLHYRNATFSLKAGDCVFIDCKESYAHETDPKHLWQLQWVHFNGESLPGIYEKYVERGGQPVFFSDNIDTYRSLLDSLYSTASSEEYLRDMRINERLASLLTAIMEKSWKPEHQTGIRHGSGREYTLQDIKEYLDENWASRMALSDLADKFFINKFYLTRLFKSRYGIPVLTYVLRVRITHAKHQLRFTEKSVESIGLDCGFEDANYFSRAFKKVEGVSPLEYRKTWVQ